MSKVKIFLGGDCSDDNKWRKSIKKDFSDLNFIDPFDKDWEAEENIYSELEDLVKCDHIIFYKGGKGTIKEKQFADNVGLKYHEFDDIHELRKFLDKVGDVKPNVVKVANSLKQTKKNIIAALLMERRDYCVDGKDQLERAMDESRNKNIDKPATLKNINEHIKNKYPNLDIQMVKGSGYFYFQGEDGFDKVDSIYVHSLSQMSLKTWIELVDIEIESSIKK